MFQIEYAWVLFNGNVQWGFWISGFLDLFNVFSLNSKDWVNMVQLPKGTLYDLVGSFGG